jgi:hypothetical protein
MTTKIKQKTVQVLTCISPNTWWVCSGNHHVRVIRTKKTQAFWSGSSGTWSASTYNHPHQIGNNQLINDRSNRANELPLMRRFSIWWPRQQKYQILSTREWKSLARAPCLERKTGADARIRKRKNKTGSWPSGENWRRKIGNATWCSNPRPNHKKTELGWSKRWNLGTLDSTPSWKCPWRTARELKNQLVPWRDWAWAEEPATRPRWRTRSRPKSMNRMAITWILMKLELRTRSRTRNRRRLSKFVRDENGTGDRHKRDHIGLKQKQHKAR